MINVLSVIAQLNFGGGENRLLNLARSIDSRRFRHTVAILYAAEPSVQIRCGDMQREFAAAGVKLHALGLPHPIRRPGVRLVKIARTATILGAALAKLRQLINATRADVVDAHMETALYTAVPAAASAGVPAAITLYSELQLWKMYDTESYTRVFFPAIRRFNLRLCSAIVTDSDIRAVELSRFVGRASPPVHVIANGVRLAPSRRSRSEMLREFGIPDHPRATVIGQVAGLVPFKGQAVLLEAAQRILSKGFDVYVLCVGYPRRGPAYPLQLQQQAEKLGISDRVRIKAYPGDIADVWNAIDIQVHASSIDSLPNAIIEGMSLGKPAVVSAVGGIPDLVENGRTGLVIPPDDPAALAAALLRLLEDEAYAKQLGQAAHDRYLQHFTPDIITRRMESCFEGMVQARRNAQRAS